MSRTGKRGTLAAAGWVTFALVAGAAGVLAGRGFAADEAEQVVEAPVSHEVTVGTVGHEVRFEAQGSWPMAPLVWATQGGVVTSVDLPDSGRVEAGDQLLSVALRPVVAVPGEVPASRDLTVGTRGPDVRQLQEFLVDQEHLAVEPDGVFRDHTRRAVVAWQREVGFPADGVVRLGDVAFFAELPAWVTLSPGVAVGAGVGAGQPLMEGAIGSAVVEIVTSPEQAALLPEPKALLAQVAGHSWPGRLGVPATGADGQVRIPVESNR
ncbi:MAG: peptidoglycan-binding protein, partial [Promicromonosporaceae bacterium]|nr:peptidoglycan-binding protein [Promicromonosporaceae bacterium]